MLPILMSGNRNAQNRLGAVKVGASQYTYQYPGASPLAASLTRPSGSVTAYQYDNMPRLVQLANKKSSGEILNKYVYTYDENDQRATETITNGAAMGALANQLTTYDTNAVNGVFPASVSKPKFFHYRLQYRPSD